MKKEELQNRIDNALELEDLLSLPQGFHVARNIFGQEMYIRRESIGDGYSLMFRTIIRMNFMLRILMRRESSSIVDMKK